MDNRKSPFRPQTVNLIFSPDIFKFILKSQKDFITFAALSHTAGMVPG